MIYGDRRKIYFFIMTAFEQFVAPLCVLLAEFIGCGGLFVTPYTYYVCVFKGILSDFSQRMSRPVLNILRQSMM